MVNNIIDLIGANLPPPRKAVSEPLGDLPPVSTMMAVAAHPLGHKFEGIVEIGSKLQEVPNVATFATVDGRSYIPPNGDVPPPQHPHKPTHEGIEEAMAFNQAMNRYGVLDSSTNLMAEYLESCMSAL